MNLDWEQGCGALFHYCPGFPTGGVCVENCPSPFVKLTVIRAASLSKPPPLCISRNSRECFYAGYFDVLHSNTILKTEGTLCLGTWHIYQWLTVLHFAFLYQIVPT